MARGNPEPPASVAEAVSSWTIADAFAAAGEGAALPPQAPRRFIPFFPSCSAAYNKAWKLTAPVPAHGERCTTWPPGGVARASDLGPPRPPPTSGSGRTEDAGHSRTERYPCRGSRAH